MKKIVGPLSLNAALTCLLLLGRSTSLADDVTAKSAQAAPQGPVLLKVQWTVGKRYVEQMTMDQDMEITIPGNPKPIHQQMEMQLVYSLSALKALPDGGVEVEMKFVSQKMSNSMDGMQLLNFDSTSDPAKDGANAAAASLRKAIGGHVNLLVNAKGKIEKVEGYDEFMKQISEGAEPQVEMMIEGMYNEDALKQFAERAQGLPDKPVKAGDTWPYHMEMGAGPMGMLKMNLNYKFTGWEQHEGHNCALLTYSGDLTSVPATNNPGMSMTIDKGTMTGKGWFDPALGTEVAGVADQTMTMKVNIGGQTSDAHMNQKVHAKLVEIGGIAK